MNLRYGEYWLLSDAPAITTEAVNLTASAYLAKRCGIPHVVIISDACRTAPVGTQAQEVTGGAIFPSRNSGGPGKFVDIFYAILIGDPALEIPEKEASVSRYQSIYTEEVRSALKGELPALLTPGSRRLLLSHPLRRHLTADVPRLLAKKLGATSDHTQVPDADILSDDNAFLQEFDPASFPADDIKSTRTTRGDSEAPLVKSSAQVASEAVKEILKSPGGSLEASVTAILNLHKNSGSISSAINRESSTEGPRHFESNCGFKIFGAGIRSVHSHPGVLVEQLDRNACRVFPNKYRVVNTLLELEDGRLVFLPAIADFICALNFEAGGLAAISYEPSDRSSRWGEYSAHRAEITAVRAIISSSVKMGVFRLDADRPEALMWRTRYHKNLDPTLAIFAAYG